MNDYVETGELSLEPMELECEEDRVFGDFSSLDEGPGNATVVADEEPSVQEQSSTRQPDSVFGERPSAFERKARANGYVLEPLAGEKQRPKYRYRLPSQPLFVPFCYLLTIVRSLDHCCQGGTSA